MAMTRHQFSELVAEALDELPAELAAAMDNVVVLVEDRNPEQPSLLGLYEGVSLTSRTTQYASVLPDRITLYQDTLQAACDNEQELRREVTVTVVHEVAHHFGIGEERLHELGWG